MEGIRHENMACQMLVIRFLGLVAAAVLITRLVRPAGALCMLRSMAHRVICKAIAPPSLTHSHKFIMVSALF